MADSVIEYMNKARETAKFLRALELSHFTGNNQEDSYVANAYRTARLKIEEKFGIDIMAEEFQKKSGK